MKKTDSFLFELFQDPLFTMIAIILMGTVWIILPGKSIPVETEAYLLRDEIESLKKEIKLKEEKIEQLKKELKQFQERLRLVGGEIEVKESDKETIERDSEKIDGEIKLIKKEIDSRKKELETLEEQLRKIKAQGSRSREEDYKLLLDRIDSLEREIARKRDEYNRLGEKIKRASQEMEKKSEMEAGQKNFIPLLQTELRTKLEEIKKLQEQVEKAKGGKSAGGGFKPVFESNKKPVYIELVQNRLFPVDEKYYDAEYGYLKMEGGSTVSAAKKTRKASIQGESTDKIQRTDSDFHGALKKLDHEKERIVFLLHEDSFEIFRKARAIALSNNYEISWWPFDANAIILTSGAGSDDIPSTDRPQKR